MTSVDEPSWAGSTAAAELLDLLTESQAALHSGQCAPGAEMARRAIQLAVELDDRVRQAAALSLLARQLTRMGDFELCATVCASRSWA